MNQRPQWNECSVVQSQMFPPIRGWNLRGTFGLYTTLHSAGQSRFGILKRPLESRRLSVTPSMVFAGPSPDLDGPVAAAEARGLALAGVVITVMFVCCVGGFGTALAVLVWRLIDRAGDLP